MKKILSIILVSGLLFGLAGCSGSNNTDEYGNEYSVKGSTYTVYVENFPYEIDYNGETLVFEGVNFFQRDERDGSSTYDLFVMPEFDISQLDDQNQFWVTSDMQGEIRITSEDNEMKNTVGLKYGYEKDTDTGVLVYVFSPLKSLYRYSFVGADVILTLSLSEEEGEYEEIDMVYTGTVPEDLYSRGEVSDIYGYNLSIDLVNWEY